MTRFFVFVVFLPVLTALLFGCSGGHNPISLPQTSAPAMLRNGSQSQTHLWGYYTVSIDPESGTVDIVPFRNGNFTANVVNLLNSKPAGLSVALNNVVHGSDFTDVDIDVSITHPFPGLTHYNAYDVRGIFMGDGSGNLLTHNLAYPIFGTDQFMMADPENPGSKGGPDGYTRWFNYGEFSGPGMPLFLYTQGKLATPGYGASSNLNPYKYFADGLSEFDDLWTWLDAHPDYRGTFASGASNTRNYYLRFPDSKGIKFGYAVTANWSGPEPEAHPSSAPETIALSVNDVSDVFYVSPTDKGGNIKLDISAWNWDSSLSAGMMEEYKLFIESTVLSGVYELAPSEMTPMSGTENYSTYHVEIPADNVESVVGNEYWVIVEESNFDHSNPYGIMNNAWDDKLTAFFRYDLIVSGEPSNQPPLCDLFVVGGNPVEAWSYPVDVDFDATGCYDPDPGDSIVSWEWDFNGNDIYDEIPDDSWTGTNPDYVTHTWDAAWSGVVNLRITDSNGAATVCSIDPFDVVDASCGVPTMPEECAYGGDQANRMQVGAAATRDDPVSRVIAFRRAQYSTYYRYEWVAYNVADGGATWIGDTENSSVNSRQPLSFVVASDDTVYYYDYYTEGGYPHYTQLFYCKWDSVDLTFTDMRTPFGPELPADRMLVHVTIDENDYPIIMTEHVSMPYLYNDYYIMRWNGTDWGTETQIPPAVITECQPNFVRIYDFDYNPVTGDYIIMEDKQFSGIFALDADMNVTFREDNIFELGSQTDYLTGIFIDKDDPNCRMFVISGTWVANKDSYAARYDPYYQNKGISTLINSSAPFYTPCHGTGCVLADNNDPPTYWYIGNAYYQDYNYQNIAKVEVPEW